MSFGIRARLFYSCPMPLCCAVWHCPPPCHLTNMPRKHRWTYSLHKTLHVVIYMLAPQKTSFYLYRAVFTMETYPHFCNVAVSFNLGLCALWQWTVCFYAWTRVCFVRPGIWMYCEWVMPLCITHVAPHLWPLLHCQHVMPLHTFYTCLNNSYIIPWQKPIQICQPLLLL